MWWACALRSWLSLVAGKSASSEVSTLRVSSISACSICKSNRLQANLSEVFSVFSVKSLPSRVWSIHLGPFPDEPVFDLTVISTRGITTLFNVVKIAPCRRFLTTITALSTGSLILSSLLFPWLDFGLHCQRSSQNFHGGHKPAVRKFHSSRYSLWYHYQLQNHSKFHPPG